MQMYYSGSQFWDNRGRILRVTDKQSIIQLRPDTESHSFSHGGLTVSYNNFLQDTRGRGTRGEQVDFGIEINNNKPFINGNECFTMVQRVGDGLLRYNIMDNMKNVNINPVRNEHHNQQCPSSEFLDT